MADAGGRLLRVERAPLPGAAGARGSSELRLIFDVGIVSIGPGGAPADPGRAEAELLEADEEEPWWALLGHPLTRVSVRERGELLLQFRADDASPKVLLLAADGPGVAVRDVV